MTHKEAANGRENPQQRHLQGTKTSPYADAALDYRALGWAGTLTLPYGKKSAPPSGYTGYSGAYPDDETVATWSRAGRRNIALRMPDTVLGLDVDEYGKKSGADTLSAAEARLGALPPTFRSSSRGPGVSGIRFYRVPAGRQWAGELSGGCVETIHHGHRYAVVWPSVHPDTEREYQWYNAEGEPCGPPAVADLPTLPEAWTAELDRGPADDRTVKADLDTPAVGEWLRALPDGEPCRAVEAELEKAELRLNSEASAGSRHGVALARTMALVRLGEKGHPGVPTALGTLEAMFTASLNGDRRDNGEFQRMVAGAVGGVVGSPSPEEEQGCGCSTAAEDFADADQEDLWATPTLQHIRQAAHSRTLSAPAMLCYVLARVLAEVPPGVVLPAVIGAPAPLNLGVAIVGRAGRGKSSMLAASRELAGIGPLGYDEQQEIERVIGSGEGIAESFLQDETVATPQGGLRKTGRKVLVEDPRRIMIADEVDQIAAVGSRSGSTLWPVLRTALSGGALGSANADQERRRHVPGGAYRLVLLLGVQPTRAAALLRDADAGTPQRLLWVSAQDPTIPDEPPEWPGSLDWADPDEWPAEIDYPEHIKREVRAEHLRASRAGLLSEDAGSLEGHRLLTQLKVATALALLHGDTAIKDQWWDIAEVLVRGSMGVQAECLRVLADEAAKLTLARGREDAVRKEGEAAYRRGKVEKAARAIWKVVHDHANSEPDTDKPNPRQKHTRDAGCTNRCVYHALRHFDEFRSEATQLAKDEEWVIEKQVDEVNRWLLGPSKPKPEPSRQGGKA
ncbi:bifunctional DNA primase/polymerase [Sinomonas sp. R1AF57]|uniref:bifunctional DNA primase/polymerase n=1 Tax=Sinomonas sp. R1AF57 TaxID=2020377 RepID=UPI000B616742|nr:bifunctional DNA primase/polymerase [Sinomonas sp. R1AF57]ASN52506.1 hypothetical protein CGQ25_10815 [Sinomonas sp. R1AF57]